MKHPESEALIVLGGGLTLQEQLTDRTSARVETAISAWRDDVAPTLVTSGGFVLRDQCPTSISEAGAMKDYAVDRGVPINVIAVEEESLDTIGNALFTRQIVIRNGWERLKVVTSPDHLLRSLTIFRYVYGNYFEIEGLAAAETTPVADPTYEQRGFEILRAVTRGIKPGDGEAIKERLYEIVPVYAQAA